MAFYALKRLAIVFLILVVMSVLVFLATHALPADTAQMILGQYATPDKRAALEHRLGLDLPLWRQYWLWASGVLHGDLGQSLVMERPIAPVLWTAFGNSAILAVGAMSIVTGLGLSFGIVGAMTRGRWPDHLLGVLVYLGLAVPEFYWGLLLILVFCSYLHLLPSSGAGSLADGFWPFVSHLILPTVTLTFSLLAHVSRMTRSSMLEVLDTKYIRAARARGLPEHRVVLHHALRNALIPTITVLSQDFGFLIGGIVAVEAIFAYPGLGRLLIYSLERLDLPMMQAATLVLTAVYCLENLAADLLYGVVNPQIRFGATVD